MSTLHVNELLIPLSNDLLVALVKELMVLVINGLLVGLVNEVMILPVVNELMVFVAEVLTPWFNGLPAPLTKKIVLTGAGLLVLVNEFFVTMVDEQFTRPTKA